MPIRDPWMCKVCPPGDICPDIDGHIEIENRIYERNGGKWIDIHCASEGCKGIFRVKEQYQAKYEENALARKCLNCLWKEMENDGK